MTEFPSPAKLEELISFVESSESVVRFQFDSPVHSVQEAIDVSGFEKSEFIKSICMKHKKEDIFIVAIIPGSSKVDKKMLVDGINPKKWVMATPDQILTYTGFPVGGVPPVCLPENILKFVDPRVILKEFVVGGGGTRESLLRLPSKLIAEDGAEKRVISFG